MTTTKATHKGTCQICNATQKLPGGVLAVHGYNVKFGFFSGVCIGSNHAPFEQSKEFVQAHFSAMEKWLSEQPTLAPLKFGEVADAKETKLRNAIRETRAYLAFQKPRLASWAVRPLREVEAEEIAAKAQSDTKRVARHLSRALREAKENRDKLTDQWSLAFLRATEAAGISREERSDMTSAMGKWFDSHYYGTPTIKRLDAFANADIFDARQSAAKVAMLDLAAKIVAACNAVADAKAAAGK